MCQTLEHHQTSNVFSREVGVLKALELSTKIPADLIMMTDSHAYSLSHLFQYGGSLLTPGVIVAIRVYCCHRGLLPTPEVADTGVYC